MQTFQNTLIQAAIVAGITCIPSIHAQTMAMDPNSIFAKGGSHGSHGHHGSHHHHHNHHHDHDHHHDHHHDRDHHWHGNNWNGNNGVYAPEVVTPNPVVPVEVPKNPGNIIINVPTHK